jgi:hypothetical protein
VRLFVLLDEGGLFIALIFSHYVVVFLVILLFTEGPRSRPSPPGQQRSPS